LDGIDETEVRELELEWTDVKLFIEFLGKIGFGCF